MKKDIQTYHAKQNRDDKQICDYLHDIISKNLPHAESKVWHAHPVWFLDGNPIVGYSKLKNDVRIMFWSGQSFDEPDLEDTGSFKAAVIRYTSREQINHDDIERYLKKAEKIQWNYRDIMKNRGLIRLK